MAMDFSGSAGAASDFDLIPNGQLAFAILNVRGQKASASGGAYLDCELTIAEGQPFAGRKLWDMIGDPFHQGNSEKYRQMGMLAITRILEAGRGASPNNPAGYQLNDFRELDGLKVAIKVGIEAGNDGHDDKNRVKEWLTPNPASQSGFKHYKSLTEGVFNANGTAAPAAATGFGGAKAPVQTGFGNQGGGGTAAPATTGFGNPQPGFGQPQTESSAPGGANGATTAASPSSTTDASASPSSPGATPGWLSQAGTTS